MRRKKRARDLFNIRAEKTDYAKNKEILKAVILKHGGYEE